MELVQSFQLAYNQLPDVLFRVWQFLERETWNPLLGGMIGGLVGAFIGGRYVLLAPARERELDKIAAGRALSAELEQNVVAAVAIVAGRSKPLDYIVWRP